MTLLSLGITPLALPTSSPDFLPSPEAIRELLKSDRDLSHPSSFRTKNTRFVVLVTPNNPTGAIYEPDRIEEIAKICREWEVALILDET